MSFHSCHVKVEMLRAVDNGATVLSYGFFVFGMRNK